MTRFIIVAQAATDFGYLYWSGVSWEKDIKRARFHESEKSAMREADKVSRPRVVKPGTPIEVLTA